MVSARSKHKGALKNEIFGSRSRREENSTAGRADIARIKFFEQRGDWGKRPFFKVPITCNEVSIMSDTEQKTLCAHVADELHVKNPPAYIALIEPATHYCQNCGRSVAKAENVCNPRKMS
jgi:hypothetical protein